MWRVRHLFTCCVTRNHAAQSGSVCSVSLNSHNGPVALLHREKTRREKSGQVFPHESPETVK
jgi:hypothetical protein